MDKIDGPYYSSGLFKRLRDSLPAWLPLVGIDLGDTNVVPVDYVAKATEYIAHLPGHDGQAFHLVNPEPQPTTDVLNTFAAAAKAPQLAVPVDRSVTGGPADGAAAPCPAHRSGLCAPRCGCRRRSSRCARRSAASGSPRRCSSTSLPVRVRLAGDREGARRARGSPAPTSSPTPRCCGPTGRTTSTTRSPATSRSPTRCDGRTVVITGASSGIGKAVALKVAQAGGIPMLVARGKDKLEDTKAEIESAVARRTSTPATSSDLEAIDGSASSWPPSTTASTSW